MTRPIRAIISLRAMRHNLACVRAAAPGARVWAVTKANAYGHGLHAALAGFADADGLALIEFDAAARLRVMGWRKPILMLEGAFTIDDVMQASRDRLALVVHESGQIDWLASLPSGHSVEVYLKFNSGMNRLGFDMAGFREAHRRLAAIPSVAAVTLMTHFANADLPGGARQAWHDFQAATDGLTGNRSVANSAAVLSLRDLALDSVRPGVMLYGATPFADRSAASLGLLPAMRLESRLIAVRTLMPGAAVGYGSRFVAGKPMRIGVVACGYADGYPRHAPDGTPVAVRGVRTGIVGRVAMDMLMVDLEPVPGAEVGDPVELWGNQVAIDEVAAVSGTIGYELMCALAPRVPVSVDAAE
jgi:alanine racemase